MFRHQSIPVPPKKKPITYNTVHSILKACKSMAKLCTLLLFFNIDIIGVKADMIHHNAKRILLLTPSPVLLEIGKVCYSADPAYIASEGDGRTT